MQTREPITNRSEQLKNEANQAYERRDYQRVISLTDATLAQNSRDHVAYYLRASARCDLGSQMHDKEMVRNGIGDSREALRYGGGRNNLYYIPYIYGMVKLAELEDKKAHAETALQVADQALGRPSLTTEEKAHLTFQRAGARKFLGQFDEAIADLDAAIQIDPKLLSAYLERGEAYMASGKPDKAGENYDKLVAAFPSSAMAYDYRGVFLQQQGKFDEAIADFNRAMQFDPKYHSAYINRGFTLMEKGQPVQAEADFNQALKIVPNEPMVYTLRGGSRLSQGKAVEAVADQQQAVQLLPEAAPAHADLGFALYFAGRNSDALASLEKAQSLDPAMRSLDAWRFVLLSLLGRNEDAKKLTAASVAKEAKDREWIDQLLAFQGGAIGDEELLKVVSNADPEGAEAQVCEAHFYIGMQKKLSGDAAGADAHFQKALETHADRLSAYRGAQFALKKFTTASKAP